MEAALQSSKEWVIAAGFVSSLGRGEQGIEEPVVSACYPKEALRDPDLFIPS